MVVLGYHYSVLAPSVNNRYEANVEEWGERHFGRHFLRKKSGAMRLYPTALFKLLLPVLMISCAYWARSTMAQLEGESRVILLNLPYLICVVALFLAYQFNRCRLMLASCAVAVIYWQVQSQLQVSLSEPEAARIYLAASLALPVLSFYLLLLPERGIWNIYGLITTLAFIFLGLICIQLGAWLAPESDAATGLYAVRPADGYVLSYAATVLVGLAALAGVVLLLLRNEEGDAALLGAFAALYVALALLHLDHISVAMSIAAGLCLVWGLLRSSYAMAYRDELTGLLGRRALNERLKSLGPMYSIAMLDVDHFKRFNDKHGHDVGDEVLRLVASRIGKVGSGGTAYRYGGEEFCIVFPRKTVEDCVEPLGRVREQIADYKMSLRDRQLRPVRSREGTQNRGATRLNSRHVSVTISAGLAARGEKYPAADAVIVAADEMLYKAKKAGRNRLAY